jgi:hypothetical protein
MYGDLLHIYEVIIVEPMVSLFGAHGVLKLMDVFIG